MNLLSQGGASRVDPDANLMMGSAAYRHGGGLRSVKGAAQRFLAALPRTVPAQRAVVLAYHSVAAEPTRASTAQSVFRSHLSWIAEHCEVVAFEKLASPGVQRGNGSRPRVAITFDDGYEDNHREAFPLLTSHGFPATFFITTGLVDRDELALARLRRAWISARTAERTRTCGCWTRSRW